MKKSYLSIKIIIFVLGLFVIIIFSYGYFYEKNNVVLEKIVIKKNFLESELRNLKLIHFSDLHFKKKGIIEDKVQKIINEIKPDIIFFTGDLFDSGDDLENSEVFNDALEYLSSLIFKKFFFLALGEDEYIYRDILKERFREANIIVLDNEIYSVKLGSTQFNIIGITQDIKNLDTYYSNDRYHKDNVYRFYKFIEIDELNQYKNYRFYVGGQYSLKWEDYEVSTQIRTTKQFSKYGIAFYSQFPMGINKSYFLELDTEKGKININSFNENDIIGKKSYDMQINHLNYYKIKLNVQNVANSTKIRAKIWELRLKEPDRWQIDCQHIGKNRSTRGTIGFSHIFGKKSSPFQSINVRILNYQNGSKMFREGVRKIPLNVKDVEKLDYELWMTLDNLKEFLKKKQNIDKPYLTEKKINKLLKKNKLNGYKILISHSPTIIKAAMDKEIDLILSGDTHGGQIDIPFIDNYIFDSFEGKLLKDGLSIYNGTYLYINRGIGTSVIPIRLNCRPEITQIEFADN